MVQGAQNGARWGSGASDVHFSEMFIKQKLLGTLNIVGICHLYGPQIWIWKDLDQVCFWSCGPSLPRGVYKIKIIECVLNRYPLNSA